MNVKIDTKEKFTVITPNEAEITANMTVELADMLLEYMKKSIPHIIFNMENVGMISVQTAEKIAATQQQFYENNYSFVICCLSTAVEKILEEADLIDVMNITPTESEAWDIVQMEEIERELMSDFDNNNEE